MIVVKPQKLTADNYYSLAMNNAYWSASLVKSFLDCQARTMAELRGEYERPKTDALMIGSYVDAAFESKNALNRFKNNHPELYKRDGSLKSDFVKADAMVKRAQDDPMFMEYMRGRKQVIKTGKLFGVPFKARFDVLHVNGKVPRDQWRIVDLKTVKDFKPIYKPGEGRLNFADAWNWSLQMAIYQAIDGRHLPTYLACITKEDPPDIGVFQVSQERMDLEMELLKDKMELFKAVKSGIVEPERCENCAYCRATRRLVSPRTLEELDLDMEA